jgi:hypothetical protein
MTYIFGIIFVAIFTYIVCLVEHRRVFKSVNTEHLRVIEEAKVEAYLDGYSDGLEAREKKVSQ